MSKHDFLNIGRSKAHVRERYDSDRKANGFGYTDGICSSKPATVKRRKLPKMDLNKFNEPDPDWMQWRPLHTLTVPGYYWVCAPGLWPQVVKFEFVKGFVVPIDSHSNNRGTVWKRAAGPIPDPVSVYMLDHREEGRR